MKGFTLIELLVVVVIIGILAAIALPQYEMVVEKSRATEAMVNVKAIQDACQRHNQEFPDDECDTKDKIADVQLKGGTWQSDNCFLTKNFSYDIGTSGGAGPENRKIEACRKNSPSECSQDNALYCVVFMALPSSSSSNRISSTYNCEEDYAQVCKLFTSL